MRLTNRFGLKARDPLFQLPWLLVKLMETLQDNLSEIDIPAKPIDVESVVDEFYSSVILNQRGQDQASSRVSKPPSVRQCAQGYKHLRTWRFSPTQGGQQDVLVQEGARCVQVYV